MRPALAAIVLLLPLGGCTSDEPVDLPVYPELDVHSQALGCWTLQSESGALSTDGGVTFASTGTPLFFQPADLGAVLLYDPDGGYVVDADGSLARTTTLESDATLFEADYVSGAIWDLETSQQAAERYQLRNRRTGALLGASASPVTADADAAALWFEPATGCAQHPELSLDATGTPARTTWEDGDLYGFVDMHMHMFTNFGFGGGLFHGRPFHPLGVEHALPACTVSHGEEGRQDFFGFAYDHGAEAGGFGALIPDMLAGELSEPNHGTDGYPTFSEWPNARSRSTHTAIYYRWLERAWLGGLRLVMQHATSDYVICSLSVAEGWSPSLYDCEDMTAVDREIEAVYELERYIDARSGGPGQGWFRVVTSPAEARAVIAEGKLAVALGIETSNLFDCHLTPRPGGPTCDEAFVDSQLDTYYDKGVRALFPVHKYDNRFSPGDGSDGFIEAGNFFNSGHYTNKIEDCPTDFPRGYDDNAITFSGLLEPRDEYLSPPAEDLTDFPYDPIDTMLPYAATFLGDSIEGDFCQNASLTGVGEHLVEQILERGMLLEVDHLPTFSYLQAYEMLEAADYPALGTHGRDNNGRLFALGGLSQGSFRRCHDPDEPRTTLAPYQARLASMVAAGMHPSLGFAFDFNGFAGARGPRFGEGGCSAPQENPVTYPFLSFDGAVTFTAPTAGERVFDFNTEGLMHVGLIPELIQDLRNDGATEEDLEPLFRSAEGYIRLWEKAEARAEALRDR